jgi:hypothetical protein
MVVLAIDKSYPDRLAAESLGCIQTAKAPADDHDMRYLLVCHIYLITIVVFGLITFPGIAPIVPPAFAQLLQIACILLAVAEATSNRHLC